MAAPESQTYFLKRGHLQAFSEALDHAIRDRQLESERSVRYYYDADVLIWLVLGFQNEGHVAAQHEKTRLVHALLAAGYLGPVHVLRPHALELYSVLRRQPPPTGPFNARVRGYIKDRGVARAVKDMLVRLAKESDSAKRIDILLGGFREHGAETFATFALANGSWQQRFRSMAATLLRFDWTDPADLHETLMRDDVWTFYHAIAGRRLSPDDRSMNNLADAAAMAALSRIAASKDSAVRFFTRTRGLRELVEDDAAASLLMCPFTDRTILRSVDYYIVRASFEALAFPPIGKAAAGDSAAPAASSLGVAELRSMNDQLVQALAATSDDHDVADEKLLHLIEDIRVNDEYLPDVLATIEQSSFLERIFSKYPPPARLRKVVEEVDEAWVALEDSKQDISDRLRIEIHNDAVGLQRTLGNELEDLEAMLKLIRRVYDKAVELGREEANVKPPTPLIDLGMVRWALDPGERGNALIAYVTGIIFGGEYAQGEKLTRACTDLAEHAMSPLDEKFCAAACCLLWTMSLFEDVEETITRFESACRDAERPMPCGFYFMQAAARVRARAISIPQAERIEERLRTYLAKADAKERGRLLLGLGYFLFFVWYREQQRLGRTGGVDEDSTVTRWAKESLKCGVEAAATVTDDDIIAAAFAINHQAFVGMSAGLSSEEHLQELREKLLEYHDDVWNYRFADTVAMLRRNVAVRILKELRNTTEAAEREVLRELACSALSIAADTLAKGRPYYGDREIEKHRESIDDLQIDIGCPKTRGAVRFSD
jgi:hypothetical protein